DQRVRSSLPPKSDMRDMRLQNLAQLSSNNALVLPKTGTVGQRMPIDAMRLDIHRGADGWHLAAGTRDLGNIGHAEYTARSVLRVVQHYPFTEFCQIGTGNFGFYLSRNQAPRGVPLGVNHVSFNPQALTVQQVGEKWQISTGNQQVVAEGTGPAGDAKLA